MVGRRNLLDARSLRLAHRAHSPQGVQLAQGELEPRARRLIIEGWPSDKKFRPHGIFVRKPQIFVVNHGVEQGSSLEVFEGIDNGTLVGAKWLRSVEDPFISGHGLPNSVVAVASDEVSVTTWRYWPLPVRGVARASLVERLQLSLNFAGRFSRFLPQVHLSLQLDSLRALEFQREQSCFALGHPKRTIGSGSANGR